MMVMLGYKMATSICMMERSDYRVKMLDYKMVTLGCMQEMSGYKLAMLGYMQDMLDHKLSMLGYKLVMLEYRSVMWDYRSAMLASMIDWSDCRKESQKYRIGCSLIGPEKLPCPQHMVRIEKPENLDSALAISFLHHGTVSQRWVNMLSSCHYHSPDLQHSSGAEAQWPASASPHSDTIHSLLYQ